MDVCKFNVEMLSRDDADVREAPEDTADGKFVPDTAPCSLHI